MLSRRETIVGAGTVLGGAYLATPTLSSSATQAEDIDVFFTAGQSNTVGAGDSAESPTVTETDGGTVYEFDGPENGLVKLDDPVGGHYAETSQTGSAWPAFADEWFTATGRTACIVHTAQGGSTTHRDAALNWGTWDPRVEDSWYDTGLTAVNECLLYLSENGWSPTLQGIVWCQGETDARGIDEDSITREQYEEGLERMVSSFRSDLSDDALRFFVCETGKPNDGDTTGFEDVRAVQNEVAGDDPYFNIVSDVQKTFPDRGLMADRLHYTQGAYNEMGTETAESVIAHIAETCFSH